MSDRVAIFCQWGVARPGISFARPQQEHASSGPVPLPNLRAVRSDHVLRGALWASVALNALGVAVLALLAVGRPSPLLPVPLSPFLAGQVAFVIALFGGVYCWLAQQPTLHRPLLVVGGLGKLGFFGLSVAYAGAGVVPVQVAVSALPGLVLGALFLWAVRPAQPSIQRRPQRKHT